MANTKLIIIEGPDRVGKSTLIENIKSNFINKQFLYMHFGKPPVKNSLEYNKKLFNKMFMSMKYNAAHDIDTIYDRSHIGECVYGPLYRGYEAHYIFDLEKMYMKYLKSNLYLITLYDNAEVLLSREDGDSFTNEHDLKVKECNLFISAHNKSNIVHKLLLNVNGMSTDKVSAICSEFINNAQNVKETPFKQLNLFSTK